MIYDCTHRTKEVLRLAVVAAATTKPQNDRLENKTPSTAQADLYPVDKRVPSKQRYGVADCLQLLISHA